MNNLDPGLAREVSMLAQQVSMTKSLMERATSFDERVELQKQLEQHEANLQNVQNKVRASWGR